jgi:SAM-dependent methyltransferase
MTTHEKKTFFATYDWARNWRDLPWAHDEATLFLAEICHQRKPGRALDIGCGAGTDSVFLASRGWDVTSLDFMPKALEYTLQRAEAAGVTVRPVEADITEWQPDGTYDLVLDHGLLHNMDPVRHPAYRATLLKALGETADFVLLHWHPRFPGQANGRMGPRRVARDDIKAFFAPELQERFFALEEFEDLPDMVGGGMSQAYYWFNRNQAHLKPKELLAQIDRTLRRHKVDLEKLLGEAGQGPVPAELPAEHLARLLGPGRLGISHRDPEPAQLDGVLQGWAKHAGESTRRVANLLTIFASDKLGNICNAGAPKCAECDVQFCKRLRYR